jgi:hypothetical protein
MWYIDGRRCSMATTTPGWTTMGSGAGGVRFRELTTARLPPPSESRNLWLCVQSQSLYYRKITIGKMKRSTNEKGH